jgi:hypothetical protein
VMNIYIGLMLISAIALPQTVKFLRKYLSPKLKEN